jgi:hypothetical protein
MRFWCTDRERSWLASASKQSGVSVTIVRLAGEMTLSVDEVGSCLQAWADVLAGELSHELDCQRGCESAPPKLTPGCKAVKLPGLRHGVNLV